MANEIMRETWSANGVEWVRNERIVDTILAPFAEAVLRSSQLGAGNRVLDIGCGSGTLLKQAVDLGAQAVGVDISEAMVGAARERVPQATVLCGDAQTAELGREAPGRPFDRVVSRFGVMFFDDPVAAFANIRASTAPGAAMTFSCWRDADNPMFTLGTSVLTDRLETLGAGLDSAAPGPQAFRSDDRVRSILVDAGWGDVAITPVDGVCDYSIDGNDGVEERLTMVLASSTGRQARTALEPRLGAQRWAALVDEVRAELRRHLVDGVLKFTGRGWLVAATNPG